MCGSWPLEGWGSFGGFVARQNPGQMLRRMYSDRSVGWCCFRLFDFRCIRFGLFWTRFVRFSKFDRFLCSFRLCVSLSSSHPRPYLCSSSSSFWPSSSSQSLVDVVAKTDRQTDRPTDRHTERQRDRETERQTDRPTD